MVEVKMIISQVHAPAGPGGVWKLSGPCGETLMLPASSSRIFRVGLIGTRSTIVKSGKTIALAATLDGLQCPVLVLDIRRSGTGGSGSWGPLEFATAIPALMTNRQPYSFYHLPFLAPTAQLLGRYRKATRDKRVLGRDDIGAYAAQLSSGSITDDEVPEYGYKHWEIFRACYRRDLTATSVLAARAFVEGATAAGGMCVFLCAEEHLPDFDSRSHDERDEFYCHRYTAAAAVARALAAGSSGLVIERHSLRLGAEPDVDRWNGTAFI